MFDIFLIVVMLVSGLLAMVRGLMREILSLVAWACAAVATVLAFFKLVPVTTLYFSNWNEWIVKGITLGGAFFGTLIIVSVITVRFSNMIQDSPIGALDRTAGFIFGLCRGLLLVAIAFFFLFWLVPKNVQPEAIRDAKSRVILLGTADWLISLLPEDLQQSISTWVKRRKEGEPEQ
jgi:membrane protein required for colicin V production